MQNKLLPVLFVAATLACGARGQDTPAAPSAPPTPVPVNQAVQAEANPPSGTPVAAQPAQPAVTLQAPAPSQVIHVPRLPSPGELTSVAAAQGLTVEQISQTANQVTVVTRNSAGQLTTVAYQHLPTHPVAATTTIVTPAPAPVTTTVVYQESPRVIYYDRYDPFYPRSYSRYYYPPVSLSFGFGYYGGFGGHHHHRHHHHHHRHHHRGHHWR